MSRVSGGGSALHGLEDEMHVTLPRRASGFVLDDEEELIDEPSSRAPAGAV